MIRVTILSILCLVGLLTAACNTDDEDSNSFQPNSEDSLSKNVSLLIDTIFYEDIGNNKKRLKVLSRTYTSIYYGNEYDNEIPDKVLFGLEASNDYLFLLTRSCGSQCRSFVLIDIRNGKKIIETENLVHFDLKEGVLISHEGRDMKLLKIEDSKADLIETKAVDDDVQCVNYNSCFTEKIVDTISNTIQFKLEAVDVMGKSYSINLEFSY